MYLSSNHGWLMEIPWCVALSRWEGRLLRCSLHFLCEDLCFSWNRNILWISVLWKLWWSSSFRKSWTARGGGQKYCVPSFRGGFIHYCSCITHRWGKKINHQTKAVKDIVEGWIVNWLFIDCVQTSHDLVIRAIPFKILRGGGMENFPDHPPHILIFFADHPHTFYFFRRPPPTHFIFFADHRITPPTHTHILFFL